MSDRFDFGVNWKSYSEKALSPEKFLAAQTSLKTLLKKSDLNGLRFLDIGCGSGIFSIAAKRLGAREVVGVDISPNSVEASRQNVQAFGMADQGVRFEQADILNAADLAGLGLFDVVYAWGSLHHTGRMWEAIANAASLVKPGGTFTLAIYKKHFSMQSENI